MAPVYRKSLARFAVACALSSDAPPGSQGSVTAFVLRLVSDADYEVRKRTLKVMRNHGMMIKFDKQKKKKKSNPNWFVL